MLQSKINVQGTETEEEKTPVCMFSSTVLHSKTEQDPSCQFAHVELKKYTSKP